MVDCPYCDYQNDNPGSVIAHASRKTDEAHKGVGFQKAKAALEAHGEPTESTRTEESIESNSGQSEPSQGNRGGNPAFNQPDNPSQTQSAQSDQPACPDCGEPAGMSRDQFVAGKTYQCSECGSKLRWDP